MFTTYRGLTKETADDSKFEWVLIPSPTTVDELLKLDFDYDNIELYCDKGYWKPGEPFPYRIYLRMPKDRQKEPAGE